MSRYRLNTPLTDLPKVGPARRDQLAALRLRTVGDLLWHFPRAYQNRGTLSTILSALQSGEKCALCLTVGSQPTLARLEGRKTLLKFTAFDETGKLTVTFFNQDYLKSVFAIGTAFRFFGRVEHFRNRLSLSSPDFEPYRPDEKLPDFYPVYPLTKGLTQKFMQSLVQTAVDGLDGADVDPALEQHRERLGLCPLAEAFRIIHNPPDLGMLERARNSFIFEELYHFARGILTAKGEREGKVAPVLCAGTAILEDFYALLPFEPTGAQKRVIGEIAGDLSSGRQMHRLVSGDVGSGKTVCAAAAAYIAVRSGYQCAMMVPTEILAKQHYAELSALFASSGIHTELLTGSLSAAAKRKLHQQIADGTVDFVIGTHALISAGVDFHSAALVITDEQHRFGLGQRDSLAEHTGLTGQSPHILAMSATPIPRSMALVLYGDMDRSAVDELPPGRQKVSTFLVDESYRSRMEGFVEKQALEGRQTYIVCPAIEEADDDEGSSIDLAGRAIDRTKLRSAVEYAENLRAAHPSLRIGCLHGRMKPSEKEAVMAEFAAGRIDVLVSTTVIEVGVNVPNATLMIIENAERFGLSGLHQLRGRVGRGRYKSWCILVSDSPSEAAEERLRYLCEHHDGYEIALFDLKRRGPGDFFKNPASLSNSFAETGTGGCADGTGYRQSGELRFRIASLCDDTDLLLAAFSAAASDVGVDFDSLSSVSSSPTT